MASAHWLLVASLLYLRDCHCAPTWKDRAAVTGDLKGLSEAWGAAVDREVRKALIGVGKMKVVMGRREEEHRNLMNTLRKCREDKQEALTLLNEVGEQLAEEERLCQASLAGSWDECRACLDRNCIRSDAACQPGWSSVKNTMARWFWKMYQALSRAHAEEPALAEDDARAARVQAGFRRLAAAVRALCSRSVRVLRASVPPGADLTEAPLPPARAPEPTPGARPAPRPALPRVVQRLGELGLAVFHRVRGAIAAALGKADGRQDSLHGNQTSTVLPEWDEGPCGELGQNLSGCLQFHERCQRCQAHLSEDCPDVPALRVELAEALKLVNVSSQQYNQVVQMAQYHLDDTTYLMEEMSQQFGWASELMHPGLGLENIFNSIKVVSGVPEENPPQGLDPTVNSGILSPSDLTPELSSEENAESSNFIDYVIAKVLHHFKEHFETW